jgi:DNA-binding transcriptional regulator YdaS (Cro superfamily)
MNVISIAAAHVGSRKELAERMGVTPGAVSQWDKRQRIPGNRVLELEKITGISRHLMRPDIFGEPQQ